MERCLLTVCHLKTKNLVLPAEKRQPLRSDGTICLSAKWKQEGMEQETALHPECSLLPFCCRRVYTGNSVGQCGNKPRIRLRPGTAVQRSARRVVT